MKIKTSELTGRALDWAVATCEGRAPLYDMHSHGRIWRGWWLSKGGEYEELPYYSTDWAQGGPIIEREKLCIGYRYQCDPAYCNLLDRDIICWARTTAGGYLKYGPTPLIAAMRCYVTRKLGDEVDVPEELIK
jgi:hypothetical protein